MIDDRTGQVLLIIISFACEALIACTEQLNIMDEECGDGDCGTTLARGATAIKTAIKVICCKILRYCFYISLS